MRLHLAKAIRAYRRNPLDDQSKSLLLEVFTEAGLNEANKNILLAAIDETLTAYDLDFGVLDDNYLNVFIQLAQDLQAKQRAEEDAEAAEAEESEEEIEEPAELAGYDKPYLFAGSIQTAQDAKAALDEFVGILHNEGPVKGSGAAQRRDAAPGTSCGVHGSRKAGPVPGSGAGNGRRYQPCDPERRGIAGALFVSSQGPRAAPDQPRGLHPEDYGDAGRPGHREPA